MKLAVALLLSAAAHASVVQNTSVYCEYGDVTVTASDHCGLQPAGVYGTASAAKAWTLLTTDSNRLEAWTMAEASILIGTFFRDRDPKAAGAESYLSFRATTVGAPRPGYAQVQLVRQPTAHGGDPTEVIHADFGGSVAGLALPWYLNANGMGNPPWYVVPFTLGQEFDVWLRSSFDTSALFVGGGGQIVATTMLFFEDSDLTRPVAVSLVEAPEPSAMVLVGLAMLVQFTVTVIGALTASPNRLFTLTR